MRIEYNYEKVVKHTFADVEQGDIFRCGGIYLRIEPVYDEAIDKIVNAVSLGNGELMHFENDAEICLMPNTFLDVRD